MSACFDVLLGRQWGPDAAVVARARELVRAAVGKCARARVFALL